MRPLTDEIRRARSHRAPVLVLAVTTLLLPVLERIAPRLVGTTGSAWGLIAGSGVVAVVAAWMSWTVGRAEDFWRRIDEIAWGLVLCSFALAAGASASPAPLALGLWSLSLLLLARRDPSDALVLLAVGTAALSGLLRFSLQPATAPGFVLGLIVSLGGFTALTAQTRILDRAVAERDELLRRLSRASFRAARVSAPAEPAAESSSSAGNEPEQDDVQTEGWLATSLTEASRALEGRDKGWDSLVERLRLSVATTAENAGVTASVQAELTGLAPPSQKLRTHLPRLALEAVSNTVRLGDTRSVSVFLRRGDGGVVLELHDDGPATESTRMKRALSAIKGRVAALGGSAELYRDDRGWVTRVRLPCEQLN